MLNLQKKSSTSDTTRAALDGLLAEDSSGVDTTVIDNAWRGAEAYHFFMVAQRQVAGQCLNYHSDPSQLHTGQYKSALKTAVRLCEYDDILDPVDVYSILALASIASKAFGWCSKVCAC